MLPFTKVKPKYGIPGFTIKGGTEGDFFCAMLGGYIGAYTTQVRDLMLLRDEDTDPVVKVIADDEDIAIEAIANGLEYYKILRFASYLVATFESYKEIVPDKSYKPVDRKTKRFPSVYVSDFIAFKALPDELYEFASDLEDAIIPFEHPDFDGIYKSLIIAANTIDATGPAETYTFSVDADLVQDLAYETILDDVFDRIINVYRKHRGDEKGINVMLYRLLKRML